MKALRLEIEGFGPFLTRQSIDFTEFDTAGLFVISGKTGAGKSTILDAITFALYGKVPRYDGAKNNVRSDFCGPDHRTEVSLEFEVRGQLYRVTRSPDFDRPKQRGEGTTVQAAEAQLWVWEGGDWSAVAMKPREVGVAIQEILQLTADQFLQVILLAQGRFAEFLQAGSEARIALLRSLFGTGRFEELEKYVRAAANGRRALVEEAQGTLSRLLREAATVVEEAMVEEAMVEEAASGHAPSDASSGDASSDAAPVDSDLSTDFATPAGLDSDPDGALEWLTGMVTRLREAAQALDAQAAQARQVQSASEKALIAARHEEQQRERLVAARTKVESLEAGAQDHAAQVAALDAATKAAPVAAPLATWETSAAELEAARARHEDAAIAAQGCDPRVMRWETPPGDLTAEELDRQATVLAGQRGQLDAALAAEQGLAALEAKRDQAARDHVAAQESVARAQTELDALPAQEQDLRTQRDQAAALSARQPDLAAAVDRAQQDLAAHDQVSDLDQELAKASELERLAVAAHKGAADRHSAFLNMRLASESARLAKDLVDGQPCTVCGSLDHPQPAKEADGHVTDADVEQALQGSLATAQESAAAHDVVVAARTAAEAAREAVAHHTRDQAHQALDAAKEQLTHADQARTRLGQLDAELATLETQRESLTATVTGGRSAVEQAAAGGGAAAATVDDATRTITAGTGECDSVAQRVQLVEAATGLVAALAKDAAGVDSAARSEHQARQARDRAIEESGLGSTEAAQAAILPAPVRARLEQSIRTYQEELDGARAVVAELTSANLPEQPADLSSLEEAASAAGAAAQAADRQALTAQSRTSTVVRLTGEYGETMAASAKAREAFDLVETLANSLEGKEPNDRRMRLESFVLAARLEEIIAAANARLTTMSSGQYQLEYDDGKQHRNVLTGLGILIADAHTGRTRHPKSLSGGETFLASLALALGLSETVTAAAGGITLDTIFIDEGFGSLDGDTLEIAMSTLEDLRDSGRTVGLISHVETMKEAIPAKLDVIKAADGSSRVRVNAGDGDA